MTWLPAAFYCPDLLAPAQSVSVGWVQARTEIAVDALQKRACLHLVVFQGLCAHVTMPDFQSAPSATQLYTAGPGRAAAQMLKS